MLHFYDTKTQTTRKLKTGSLSNDIRNTHNYIKSVLIDKFVPPDSILVDLGCGQGGDLLKLKKINEYHGIDVSIQAIKSATNRAKNLNLSYDCYFLQMDMQEDLSVYCSSRVNCILANFSFHYICTTEQNTYTALQNIYNALRNDGIFLGCIPEHFRPSFTRVKTKHPGENRLCEEPVIDKNDLVQIAQSVGFRNVLCLPFSDFMRKYKNKKIYKKMNICVDPIPNTVFVFVKPQ